MKQIGIICLIAFSTGSLFAQHLELLDRQDFYQASAVQKLKIPLRLKNISDKQQVFIIKKVANELHNPSKGYFCNNNICQDLGINDFSLALEANETTQHLYYVLETGIINGQTNLRFEFFQKGIAKEITQHTVTVNIEEKSRPFIFQSKEITVQDVYPNPASDQAFIEYRMHAENVKAKLLIHNILGRILGDYVMPSTETKMKIPTEDLPSGVYFYTLYLDQEGVLTRKLVVRK